jgi:CrcB protein
MLGSMLNFVLIGVGGGLGAIARYISGLAILRVAGEAFPWSTLLINGVGSFLMGLLVGWLALKGEAPMANHLRLLLATGFLGGFTTFSTFSLEAVMLWERNPALAAAYMGGSVALGVAGLMLGLWLGRVIF